MGETPRDVAIRTVLAEHQALLFQLARDLGPADELQPVLQKVLSGMRSLVDFRGGTICLIDERGVYVAAADPEISAEVASARVPVGTGLAGRCVSERNPVYSPDILADPRVDRALATRGSNRGMRSYLAAPLLCLGEAIGVLQVDSTQVDAFDEDDIHLLSGLAAQVAGAIESARRFEQMRALDEARSLLVNRVSHELRTPVTIIAGFTALLLEHPDRFDVGPKGVDAIERIDAASERLHRLVERLVGMTSLERDLEGLRRSAPFDLLGLMEEVRAAVPDPTRVEVDAPSDISATSDRDRVRQMLDHLVENAIAYAGSVTLVARDGPHPTISVVDHGPGIPDAEKPTVFERFRRGPHTAAGWGLGLYAVARLAEAIGVGLALEDTPGGGATFVLSLPA